MIITKIVDSIVPAEHNELGKMKPCPFCGNENLIIRNQAFEPEYYDYAVFCTKCNAYGPSIGMWSYEGTPQRAIDKWNKRCFSE